MRILVLYEIHISNEIWVEILRWVDYNDILLIYQISKYFNRLMADNVIINCILQRNLIESTTLTAPMIYKNIINFYKDKDYKLRHFIQTSNYNGIKNYLDNKFFIKNDFYSRRIIREMCDEYLDEEIRDMALNHPKINFIREEFFDLFSFFVVCCGETYLINDERIDQIMLEDTLDCLMEETIKCLDEARDLRYYDIETEIFTFSRFNCNKYTYLKYPDLIDRIVKKYPEYDYLINPKKKYS